VEIARVLAAANRDHALRYLREALTVDGTNESAQEMLSCLEGGTDRDVAALLEEGAAAAGESAIDRRSRSLRCWGIWTSISTWRAEPVRTFVMSALSQPATVVPAARPGRSRPRHR